MAFTNTVLAQSAGLGSGEVLVTKPYNTEAFGVFEDGLVQGRFVKYDTGSIDMLDASATPTIAGISRRLIAGETGVTTYRSSGDVIDYVAEVHTTGFITVDVLAGSTPAKYGIAYAKNTADADSGKATTVSTSNVNSGYVFWEEVSTNVWLVAKASLV